MQGRRNPFIAQEGIPLLLASAVLVWLTWMYLPVWFTAIPAAMTLVLFLVFRDPRRSIPSSALGIVSPVDGTVVSVESLEVGLTDKGRCRVTMEVDPMGTYTARSPVEGSIRDLSSETLTRPFTAATNVLWIQTDEGDNVVMGFKGYRLGLPPRSFVRYGERLGQGQRCAYLRLVKYVEVEVPGESKIAVTPGQVLVAGTDLIGTLPHH